MDTYAQFAKSAYDDHSERANVHRDYIYHQDKSTDEIGVWQNKIDNKFLVSARGTSLKKAPIKDLSTDALVALGSTRLGTRYRDLDKKLKLLKSKVGEENIILTGHSLGGTLAREAGRSHGIEAHTFNAGSGPMDIVRDSPFGGMFRRKDHAKTQHYRIKGDLVSLSKARGTNTVVLDKAGEGSRHGIDQFIAAGKQQKRKDLILKKKQYDSERKAKAKARSQASKKRKKIIVTATATPYEGPIPRKKAKRTAIKKKRKTKKTSKK